MKGWTPDQVMVYEAKSVGKPFRLLQPQELDVCATGLLLKVSIITGCNMPTDPKHIAELESEIIRFIGQDRAFSSLTFEEVISAFRLNAAGRLGDRVKHYNNIFNLDYLGEVLERWVDLRKGVEERIESSSHKYAPQLPPPKMTEDEIIQVSEDIFRATGKWMYITEKAYELLKAMNKLDISHTEQKDIEKHATEVLNAMFLMDRYLYKDVPRETMLERFCHKIAVARYFQTLPK